MGSIRVTRFALHLHFVGSFWWVFLKALIYVIYWAMSFVNPTSPAFSDDPSDPWTQSIMTCCGAFIAVLSQLLPCRNDALRQATSLATELAETTRAVIEGLPFAASRSEVCIAIECLRLYQQLLSYGN